MNIPEDVEWHIQKCDGYLDLGMLDRAQAELDAVPAENRESISYRQCELHLAFKRKDWPRASLIAGGLQLQSPQTPDFWIQRAYAVRRAEGIEPAREILRDAHSRFPSVAVIPFNLACYECQLGQLEAARKLLDDAVKLDPRYREIAAEDDDLRPLWPEIAV